MGAVAFGFDLFWWWGRKGTGAVIMVGGVTLIAYACFWPLAFGGY
jgi:hypothetical protein